MTALVRTLFLIFLGVCVACLSTISGYVALKSAPTRPSVEASSATTVGSWLIWMSMTILLTAVSCFLASNWLSPLDERRDGEGTGQTTSERWSIKLRLCCRRHGSVTALNIFDSVRLRVCDDRRCITSCSVIFTPSGV